MTNEIFKTPRGGAYTAPCAEVLQIEASRQILEGSLTIPEVTEENMDW